MAKISTLIKLHVGVTIEIDGDKVIARQAPYPGTSQEEYSVVLTDRLWLGPSVDDIRKGTVGPNPCWKEVEYVGYSESGGIYAHSLIDPKGLVDSHRLRNLTNTMPEMVVVGEIREVIDEGYQQISRGTTTKITYIKEPTSLL